VAGGGCIDHGGECAYLDGMSITPQFLDELRARSTLSEVVGQRVKLVRAGREWKACCPFHQEKSPSFTVNDQKGFYHCFGCGAHGDVVSFVMRQDNLSFIEAVELLSGKAGLEVPRGGAEDRARQQREKTLYEVVEATSQFFQQMLQLPAGRQALDYLRRRGLDDDSIAQFGLGFAPNDGQMLISALKRVQISEEAMLEAGVVRCAEDGRLFSFFRNRVMFPVGDRRGRVVAFGGRLLEGEGPKYINTSETPLFHKGSLLYGLSRARQAAADGQAVVVVEGYMDVIALVRAGWSGAVAPLGTALTETQIEALWKLAPPGKRVPILCFDGDTAGQRAARRAVERLLPLVLPDQSARVAFLPQGEDPDSLLAKQGRTAMRSVLDEARDLADMVYSFEKDDTVDRTPESIAGLKARLLERVAAIGHADVREAYRRALLDRFFAEQRPAPRPQAAPTKPGQRAGQRGRRWGAPFDETPTDMVRQRPKANVPDWQALLVGIVMARPQCFDLVGEELGMLDLAPALDRVRQLIISALEQDPGLDSTTLRDHLSEHGNSDLVAEILASVGTHARYAFMDSPVERVAYGWRASFNALRIDQLRAELRSVERMRQQSPGTELKAREVELRRQIDAVQAALSSTGEADEAGQNWAGASGGGAGGGGSRHR
jgi:DNA primase